MSTDTDNVIQLRPDRGPSETHYEVELDDSVASPEQLVDQAPVTKPPVELRPIIPASLRKGNRRPAAERAWGRTKHRVGYHGLRIPRYLTLGFAWGIVGWFKLGNQIINNYWMLSEATHWKREAKQAGDQGFWESAHRHQRDARKDRSRKIAAGAIAIVAASAAICLTVGWPVLILIVILIWPVLAHHGRPQSKPILSAATVTHRDRRINADIIVRAYSAAGLCNPEKPEERLEFLTQMERDGRGGRCIIAVPYGRTFAQVIERRAKVASGMDVSINQIFLTKDKISERAHELYVADTDPLAIPAGRTPLLKLKPTDIWKPAPFGVDERGRKVGVDMLWKSILVGAQPRYGKSFSARLLGLYAALDPHVKISVFNGEAKPDWRAFKLIAHQYASGLVMNRDGDPVQIFLESLREIKKDVQDRYRRLSEMDTDICPEGKLTRQIARNPAYKMPVRLLIIDECQEYFNTGDKNTDAEIASLLIYLVKVAPAAGLIVLDATQKPRLTAGGQIPQMFTDFRDQHTMRFALKCGSLDVSELILGAGSHSAGFDAYELPAEEEYRGVGILLGAGMTGHTVRTYLADAKDAEKILTAAKALRAEAGTLTGQAAGEEPERTWRDVLVDVRAVFLPGDTFTSWEQIAARLAEQMPEHYREIGKDAISERVRDFGVPSQNGREQSGEKQVLKGVYIRELERAMARGDHGEM